MIFIWFSNIDTKHVISLLVLIPLCSGLNGNDYQVIMFFDLLAGTIFIPFAARSQSSIPRLIVTVGLVVSMAILIPLCNGLHGDDYRLMLIFEIIAAVVIIIRMFKKPKNASK